MKTIGAINSFALPCVLVEPDDSFEQVFEMCQKLKSYKLIPESKNKAEHYVYCVHVPSSSAPELVDLEALRQMVPVEMRQRGFIIYGAGINKDAWLEDSRQAGFLVREHENHAEFWSPATKKEMADRR